MNNSNLIWEVEKARVLLNDVSKFFGHAGMCEPTALDVQKVKFGFREIGAKLSLIGDTLDGIEMTIAADELEQSA